MTDIDASHRPILTRFGVDQMTNNPAGIGNECTHWIYAALFEARALDHDQTLHIGQSGVPYTWGRRVQATDVQRGDIAQFHSYRNTFFIYLKSPSGTSRWMDSTMIRGPNHTGMVFATPRSGVYYQLESHLHQAGQTVMQVRGNTIYFESFAIAMTAAELARTQGSQSWPATVNTADIADMLERVQWWGMRDSMSVPMQKADHAVAQVRQNASSIQIDGRDIACLFVTHNSGDLRFYCPQSSTARLAMTPAQLADEKRKLIDLLIRSGRSGGRADQDQYGGDNKQERLHDHRFDWSFLQQP